MEVALVLPAVTAKAGGISLSAAKKGSKGRRETPCSGKYLLL
jgi:hypothetical protein